MEGAELAGKNIAEGMQQAPWGVLFNRCSPYMHVLKYTGAVHAAWTAHEGVRCRGLLGAWDFWPVEILQVQNQDISF
jgi:hypothetical protein